MKFYEERMTSEEEAGARGRGGEGAAGDLYRTAHAAATGKALFVRQ